MKSQRLSLTSQMLFAAAVLMVFGCLASAADQPAPGKKYKMLVLTQSKGFVHAVVKRPRPISSASWKKS